MWTLTNLQSLFDGQFLLVEKISSSQAQQEPTEATSAAFQLLPSIFLWTSRWSLSLAVLILMHDNLVIRRLRQPMILPKFHSIRTLVIDGGK